MNLILANAIIPIFAVIALGYCLKRFDIINDDWIGPANTVTYYVAIPAMLFRAMVKQSPTNLFVSNTTLIILIPLAVGLAVAVASTRLKNMKGEKRATFIHSSVHGNIGYMAYAVGFYGLGSSGFHNVVLLSSVLIIAQNTLAVLIFVFNQGARTIAGFHSLAIKGICANPIIISVLAGICWSMFGLNLPACIDRFINILASMGLPTALLLIGSGLTFHNLRGEIFELTVINVVKLLIMPLCGIVFLHHFSVSHEFVRPMIILLGAPSATVTYVMAKQLKGDPHLASTAVSVGTLLCGLTYSVFFIFF